MTNHSNRNALQFVCAWYSPRGFANEGAYLYGTLVDYRAYLDADRRVDGAKWFVVSKHRSADAAQASAECEVRESRRRKAWGEQDYTSTESLAQQ